MDVADLTTVLGAVARVHAPRLELAAERAGRDLAVHVLSGQPHLDVVGLLRGKAHVAGAERDQAVVQIEPAQDFLGAGEHALVLVPALLGRGDGDELDLVELVLADHAARILARGARLGAKTRSAGREAQRQRGLIHDGFAHEIRQRHFGGGDQPKPPWIVCNLHTQRWLIKKLAGFFDPIFLGNIQRNIHGTFEILI